MCISQKATQVVRVFFNPGLLKFTPVGSRTLGPEVPLRFLHTTRLQTRSLEAFISCTQLVLYGWHSTPFSHLYIVTFLIVLYVNTMPDFKMKSLVYSGFVFCNFMCLISITRAVFVLLKYCYYNIFPPLVSIGINQTLFTFNLYHYYYHCPKFMWCDSPKRINCQAYMCDKIEDSNLQL